MFFNSNLNFHYICKNKFGIMKKISTILLIAFCSVNYIYAQSLGVTGSNSAPSSDPCLQTSTSLTVKNLLTTDTLKVLCEKVIIDTIAGTTNHFCWGANCYGTTTYISTDYNELGPGEADSFDFGGYYDAYCDLASATIQYCFFPQSNPSDRSCITVEYNGALTSVINDKSNIIKSGFYPNPANEKVNFNNESIENSNLKIIDILGNTVKNIDLGSGGTKQIYIGDLNKGVYFGNLFQSGRLITIKKLIVK